MQAHAGHAWSNGSTRRECHSATSCPATCDVVDKRTHDIISHTQPSNGRRLDHQVLCDSLTTLHCTTNNALARPLNDNARASTPHGAGTSSSTNSHTVHTPEHSRPPTQAEEEALGNPPPIPEKTRERRKVLNYVAAACLTVAALYAYNNWVKGVAETTHETIDIMDAEAAAYQDRKALAKAELAKRGGNPT